MMHSHSVLVLSLLLRPSGASYIVTKRQNGGACCNLVAGWSSGLDWLAVWRIKAASIVRANHYRLGSGRVLW